MRGDGRRERGRRRRPSRVGDLGPLPGGAAAERGAAEQAGKAAPDLWPAAVRRHLLRGPPRAGAWRLDGDRDALVHGAHAGRLVGGARLVDRDHDRRDTRGGRRRHLGQGCQPHLGHAARRGLRAFPHQQHGDRIGRRLDPARLAVGQRVPLCAPPPRRGLALPRAGRILHGLGLCHHPQQPGPKRDRSHGDRGGDAHHDGDLRRHHL
mmetsp:Transcript_19630/g.45124  ORF Transcript_19630/g.45124 Transcript_19630/m.45124 type:complete len:208 (+) Transcript_19630:1182-1805(+)